MLRGRPREISRQLAIAGGEARYFTGKICVRGHLSERLVKDHICVECKREDRKKPGYIAKKKAQLRRRRERRKALGLTIDGKARIRPIIGKSKREKKLRAQELRAKQRAAYRALIDLGIQI